MSDIVAFAPVRALDGNGRPVSGAKALFYQAGTTTPVTVYSDSGMSVPHPSPLIADATGAFPAVFHSGVALKVVVTTPGDVVLPGYPLDPVLVVPATGNAASQISFSPVAAIPQTTVQAAIEGVQNNLETRQVATGAGLTGGGNLSANRTLALTGQALALHSLATPGLIARTGAGTVAAREIQAGAGIVVSDGDGVADDPEIAAVTHEQAVWTTGTETDEAAISPAKLQAKLESFAGLGSRFQVFTANGDFTVPAAVTQVLVTVVGGGGAGGGADNAMRAGAGGGSGAVAYGVHTVTPAAVIAVTVGAGGTGTIGNGNAGTASTFGSVVTANGGAGGQGNGAGAVSGGAGGSLTSSLTLPLFQRAGAAGAGGNGGTPAAGVGGTVPDWQAVGLEGVGGAAPSLNANGNPGARFGAGGSGTARDAGGSNTGGAGAPGIVIVRW